MYMEDEKGPDSKVRPVDTGAGRKPSYELTNSEQRRIAEYFRRYKEHERGACSKVLVFRRLFASAASSTELRAFVSRVERATVRVREGPQPTQ